MNKLDTTYSECMHGSPKCEICRNKRVIEWINVKDELPKHEQFVLAHTPKGLCITVFVDKFKMNETLRKNGYSEEVIDVSKKPYSFCSQEIKGNVLGGVTHWADISRLKLE